MTRRIAIRWLFTLEGSNDDTIASFNSGNWELITAVSNITPWTNSFRHRHPGPQSLQMADLLF
jgi:hypothetical protein